MPIVPTDKTEESTETKEENIVSEKMDITTTENNQIVLSDVKEETGLDRGLQPDRIVTVSQNDGNLIFLVAWKNADEVEAELIEASVVYRKWPLLALKFFEEAYDTSVKNKALLAATEKN